MALAGTQIWWTSEVSNAFSRLEEGYENALKDYYKKQIGQLNSLITLLLGNIPRHIYQSNLFVDAQAI